MEFYKNLSSLKQTQQMQGAKVGPEKPFFSLFSSPSVWHLKRFFVYRTHRMALFMLSLSLSLSVSLFNKCTDSDPSSCLHKRRQAVKQVQWSDKFTEQSLQFVNCDCNCPLIYYASESLVLASCVELDEEHFTLPRVALFASFVPLLV